jgi:hypothetical protein
MRILMSGKPGKALAVTAHEGEQFPTTSSPFAARQGSSLARVAPCARGGRGVRRRSLGLSESTALLLLYFNSWSLFILAVNIALIVGIVWMDWLAKTSVGA